MVFVVTQLNAAPHKRLWDSIKGRSIQKIASNVNEPRAKIVE